MFFNGLRSRWVEFLYSLDPRSFTLDHTWTIDQIEIPKHAALTTLKIVFKNFATHWKKLHFWKSKTILFEFYFFVFLFFIHYLFIFFSLFITFPETKFVTFSVFPFLWIRQKFSMDLFVCEMEFIFMFTKRKKIANMRNIQRWNNSFQLFRWHFSFYRTLVRRIVSLRPV